MRARALAVLDLREVVVDAHSDEPHRVVDVLERGQLPHPADYLRAEVGAFSAGELIEKRSVAAERLCDGGHVAALANGFHDDVAGFEVVHACHLQLFDLVCNKIVLAV